MKHKIFCVYLSICLFVLFSTSASAYIDPSVTTYLIQAVAGVAIAIGTAITLYWRKIKKKVTKNLGIDEETNKIREEEIVIFNKNSGGSEQ